MPHYHPDLVTKITEDYSPADSVPEGWMNNYALARLLNAADKTIMKLAAPYLESNPEWLKEYRTQTVTAVHYHPDLVAKITEDYNSVKLAPEGWMTNAAIADKLSASTDTVASLAEPYLKTNPEWLGSFKDSTMKESDHYHPDIVVKITDDYKSVELAPEGWMTKYSLSKFLEVSRYIVSSLVEPYREKCPEWFKFYKFASKKGGYKTVHYHPDLIAKVREECRRRKIGIYKEQEQTKLDSF